MAKPKQVDFITVVKSIDVEDGVESYTDSSGALVALKLESGRVVDLRVDAPFLAMSPCPYCGAEANRNHDNILHIDLSLGVQTC
jgi:hypothetical protein